MTENFKVDGTGLLPRIADDAVGYLLSAVPGLNWHRDYIYWHSGQSEWTLST